MPTRTRQAILILTAIFLTAAAGAAIAADSTVTARPPAEPVAAAARAQFTAEAEQLLRAAVKTPLGWGWGDEAPATDSPPRLARRRRPATIDLKATAAAGFALHVAGEELHEPRFTAAAYQAARAVAAVQSNKGQVPLRGVLGVNAGGRGELAVVPDRSATCRGLALLLTVTDWPAAAEPRPGDESLRRAAFRAAHWLASQQSRAGAWPSAFPPEATPKDARRIVRLDLPDYRDCLYALAWAARASGDDSLRQRAASAVGELVLMRIPPGEGRGKNLWTSAYNLDGSAVTKIPELRYAIDVKASRYAMQALLAASLLGHADAAIPALRDAARSLSTLPRRDGRWEAAYDLVAGPSRAELAPVTDPATTTTPESSVIAGDEEASPEPAADPGVAAVLASVARLDEAGSDSFGDALASDMPVERRLAWTLSGFHDDALTAHASRSAPDGEAAASAAAGGPARQLDESAATDLSTRVLRLGLLAKRVRSEAAVDSAK